MTESVRDPPGAFISVTNYSRVNMIIRLWRCIQLADI